MEFKHKHLAQTWLFWLALVLPLAGAVGLAWGIYLSEGNMSWCFKSSCVEYFFSLYKIPLTLAGASLPIVAMVAAVHRSKEAAIQLGLASKQLGEALQNNRFGNYLKHRETFEKIMEAYCVKRENFAHVKCYLFIDDVYGSLFPEASINNVKWKGEYSAEFLSGYEYKVRVIVSQVWKDPKDFDSLLFFRTLESLLLDSAMNYKPARRVEFNSGSKWCRSFMVPGRSDDDFLPIIHAAQDVVDILRAFRNFVGQHTLDACDVNLPQERLKILLESCSSDFVVQARRGD